MSAQRIFFRADGSTTIGLGHIYRCCALAEMVGAEYERILVTGPISNTDLSAVVDVYFTGHLLLSSDEEAAELAQRVTPTDIVVLDGYHFDTAYQQILKDAGCRLVCIDDIFRFPFVSDAVINHAGGVSPDFYQCAPYTRLFLGPEYAMVRAAFWEQKPLHNRKEDWVFVCLGGADPNNELQYVLENALRLCPELTYQVVLGSAHLFGKEVKTFAVDYPNITLHKSLSGAEMHQLMSDCSKAIISPSTVSYEYMSIGGEVYLHQIADNQDRIFRYFTSSGMAFPFHRFGFVEAAEKKLQSQNQRTVFDGNSPQRIKEAIIGG